MSGDSRGDAKEFAEPAAELSEVAAGGGETALGVGSGQSLCLLQRCSGVAFLFLVWSLNVIEPTQSLPGCWFPWKASVKTCSGSPQTGWANADASIAAERLRCAPDLVRCQSKPLWLRNVANVLVLKLKDSDLKNAIAAMAVKD